MFTGLIESLGVITAKQTVGGDSRLDIDTGTLKMATVTAGASISVDGVCLTVTDRSPGGFRADVSIETLSRTTLGRLATGAKVNLETSLTLDRPLGGHLVTGHVDCLATLHDRHDDARSVRMCFDVPAEYARYVAAKGAVCLNGVSLTVNNVDKSRFDVNIVPHTLTATNFGLLNVGTSVNMEVDIIARYLERLLTMAGEQTQPVAAVDLSFLKQHGFAKATEKATNK